MRFTLFLAVLFAPAWARAEVLDKEFSFAAVVGFAASCAIAAFWAARRRPWALAVVGLIAGVFFGAHLSELRDPSVGRAMAIEGGPAYVFASWAGPLLIVLAAVFGLVLRARHAKTAF